MPYLQEALITVVKVVLGFYQILCILRFLFQSLRVDFRNPITQSVVALTQWPLALLRGFLPSPGGIDVAGIVLILVVGIAKILLVLVLSNFPIHLIGIATLAVGEIIDTMIWTFIIAILASVVLSWVAPTTYHPAARIVRDLSDPALAPFRRLIPAIQGIDISPIFALLVLNLIQKLVAQPITDSGSRLILSVL